MKNSNYLFKLHIGISLALLDKEVYSRKECYNAIKGYYYALGDLNGADDLTEQYFNLSREAIFGTVEQVKNARAILDSHEL